MRCVPQQQVRDWIDFLEALGPLIAAAAAAFIGAVQWSLQRKQLKQELFDKRFRIYAAVTDFLGEASVCYGKIDPDAYRRFKGAVGPAKFLFRPEVNTFITQASDLVLDLKRSHERYDGLKATAEGVGIKAAEQELDALYRKLLGTNTDVFGPDLQISL
jgi:hypothetical protein